ncbi:hypothetical protein OAO42_01165, partial [Candidatus Izimaplasma bacterium]|nr:hypothetical protein [Candidatus Izimaplasma bacterium]
VEEISEAYCRENPESDICQGDLITDLQDEAVITLFNSILDDYENDIDAFCDMYFSVTNISELDQCRNNTDEIFPEGIDGYQVEKVEEGETDSAYKVFFTKDPTDNYYVFTIILVSVEGETYVESWSYEEFVGEEIDPTTLVVPLLEAKAFFEAFILEYLDSEIDSHDFCISYFPTISNDICQGRRVQNLEDEINLTATEFVAKDDKFEATVQVYYPYYIELEETIIELSFSYDNESNIIMDYVILSSFDRVESYVNYQAIYQDFIYGFISTPSPLEYCTLWMVSSEVSDCTEGHTEIIGASKGIELSSFALIDGVYEATLLIIDGADTEEVEVLVEFTYSEGNYLISQVFVEPPVDYRNVLQLFVDDFNDQSKTTGSVCFQYFTVQEMITNCIDWRIEMISNGETMAISEFAIVSELALSFVVEFSYTSQSDVRLEEILGFFYIDEYSVIQFEFDIEIIPEMYWDEAVLYMEAFFDDYNDFNIDTTEMSGTYIDPLSASLFFDMREDSILNSNLIIHWWLNDEYNEYSMEFRFTDGTYRTFEIEWVYSVDRFVALLTEVIVDREINTIDRYTALTVFTSEFNDVTLTDTEACQGSIVIEDIDVCTNIRGIVLASNQRLWIYNYDVDEETYYVEFSVNDDSYSTIFYYLYFNIEFSYNDEFEVVFTLGDQAAYTYADSYLAETALSEFIIDMNDETITDEDFCALYGSIFLDCLGFRSRITDDGLVARSTYQFQEIPFAPYLLRIGLFRDETIVVDELEFEIRVGEDMSANPIIMGREIGDLFTYPDEDYLTMLEAFLTAYLDETKSDQDVYDEFGGGFEIYGFYNRENIITEGYTFRVDEVVLRATSNYWYGATVAFIKGDNEYIAEIDYSLYSDYEGNRSITITFHYIWPNEAFVMSYADMFVIDLQDNTFSSEDFCIKHFNPIDYLSCLDFRLQYEQGDYPIGVPVVTYGDYPPYFDLTFTMDDTSLTTLRYNINIIHDIMGYMYSKVSIEHPDQALRDNLSNYIINGLVYGFNLHGINLTMFCTERAECNDAFDDLTEQIHQVTYVSVEWDFEDYFHPYLHVKLKYEFMDYDIVYHKYSATYTIEEDDYYNWKLWFMEKRIPVPTGSTLLDLTEVEAILDQFMIDIVDDTMTNEELCDLYYYGNMQDIDNCFIDRDLILDDNATVSYTPLVATTAPSGAISFSTEFSVDYPSSTVIVYPVYINIFQTPDTLTWYIVYY